MLFKGRSLDSKTNRNTKVMTDTTLGSWLLLGNWGRNGDVAGEGTWGAAEVLAMFCFLSWVLDIHTEGILLYTCFGRSIYRKAHSSIVYFIDIL